MRKLFFVLSAFLFCGGLSFAQADLTLNLLLYINSSPPDSIRIHFGLDSTATDGIDAHLGESIIPPDLCCGWGDLLCAMFVIPPFPGVSESWKDFRFGELPYTGTKVHWVDYCASQSATQVTVVWNLPTGASGTLKDAINGQIINIPISGSGSFNITENLIGLRLILTLDYDNVVPVNLITFTAKPIDNSVLISWQTTTETNNHGFEIEKCQITEGNTQTSWEAIGFVEGSGTTTETHSYSFSDENISDGKIKYRLKQIDFDGSFSYSNEVVIDVKLALEDFALYQNYPNPFNPNTTIKFSVPKQAHLKINVYNVLGELVHTVVDDFFDTGNYEKVFNAENLPSGIYVYRLETAASAKTKAMILLK